MALNNVSASLVSATNENAFALASMKVDISMIKVEVPAEYTGLNAALTSKRRIAAEEGTAHKTARRLGILFQDLLPSTPELLRAYGRRSSETSQTSTAKTEGNASGGIFANFLGADITSIWAAATSGASSIAAHLLACLLARLWSASEATSIWVEMVAERKRQVQEESRQGVYKISLELLLICKDDISRKDLAEWDAGARAWLQIADEAQIRRQKQLMLIIKNIHLPVNTEGSTYDRVLDAWTTALKAMERLICGQPQRVGKGAALIGIASWHLYPDLLVLGETMTPVRFKDELISDMGQLTVGLENTDPRHRDGVFWSLPLSQLRFYGDPVLTTAHTQDLLRVSIDELQLVTFGSAIANWGSHYLDPLKVAQFFQLLRDKLGHEYMDCSEFGWLQPLFGASEALLSATGDNLQSALGTVSLGRRNGRQFLARKENHPPPFFGIGQPFIASFLKGPSLGSERQDVERMRFLALQLGLRSSEAIIRIKSPGSTEYSTEYTTAVPHTQCLFDGTGPKHGRWLAPLSEFSATLSRHWPSSCTCHIMEHNCHDGWCTCIAAGITCSPVCHKSLDQSKEVCANSSPCIIQSDMKDRNGELCGCYDSEMSTPTFSVVAGDPGTTALFVRIDYQTRQLRNRIKSSIAELFRHSQENQQDEVPDNITMREIESLKLKNFLFGIAETGFMTLPRLSRDFTEDFYIEPYLNSLRTFQMAREVYQSLHEATVSLKVIDRPLSAARWSTKIDLTTYTRFSKQLPLDRSSRFACIAYFESGVYDLDTDDFSDVIAISTRNSLYVSSVLLGDPFDASDSDDVRHVIGNVGKTGLVMMVAPLAPKVRPTDLAKWKRVAHSRFMGEREDCFQATSLHLSFTDFEMPFDIGQRGYIDRDIHVRIVETVISVYDRADWVADLDILVLYESTLRGNEYVKRLDGGFKGACTSTKKRHAACQPLTSIDNWEELLDLPEDMGIGHVGVVRAQDNWLARLATACVAVQKGFRAVILPTTDICWECCSSRQWHWNLRPTGDESDSGDNPHRQGGISGGSASTMPSWQDGDKGSDDDESDSDDDDDDDEGSNASDDSIGSTFTVIADDKFVAAPHVFIC
ncbi:hypothetical protein B0T25DRAFT_460056 [Lasiosphaeria hispida]|uniref:Uncharacterized protein n=1 Tax=Lasiosphaeria hispida TaxID=260671 RepID=A0AAJ0HC78_9PEZI|nr:hypothetical protein B0T25DRAFT_460056 [Lasiosphaeria hispida]